MTSPAKKLLKVSSSCDIRKTFIDYFTANHGHKFIRSSPVVPFCDPSVAFVNSGMNQFKSIFLGTTQPAHKRVCNSQKCVRVGGKHNDLSVVGTDGYHHTFFEMLGNWSFGDYFKRDACEMAFELLRGPFQINPERLYVTYFAGDEALGLPADRECFEIWRSIGFPASRIIAFGSKDNFWEMGPTGPCGPCTEIHIDHDSGSLHNNNRAKFVNAGYSDLTELWNLVFIQYNRNADGSITKLPEQHVDTGMGFERLTAILQNKTSNYDTDLFTPIIDHIHKVAKTPNYTGSFLPENTLDIDYRVLADHSRMISICLGDGMLPDKNQKLRRVLRKVFTISEKTFGCENLLSEIVPVVVESLGSAFPELYSNKNAILEVIAHEQDIFKALRKSSSKEIANVLSEFPELEGTDLIESPGLLPAYREFILQKSNFKNNIIPATFLFKLTDTYGISEENFENFAAIEGMSLDVSGYKQKISEAKLKSRHSASSDEDISFSPDEEILSKITKKLSPTKNDHKYIYEYDQNKKQYIIPAVHTKVLSIVHNNNEVTNLNNVKADDTICIVTDTSNFYYESGGQQSDYGKIVLKANDTRVFEFTVHDVKLINNCVVHICKPSTMNNAMLSVGSQVELEIAETHRKMNTLHHTSTHLLNAALKNLFKKVTYQLSSEVNSSYLKFEVGLIGKQLGKDDVDDIESLIRKVISSATPVSIEYVTASDVLKRDDITIVPGEIYPENNLRLVSLNSSKLNFHSNELCCGTHVLNTQELEDFCITNMKQVNRARYAFTAVAGHVAKNVLQLAALTDQRVDLLHQSFQTDKPVEGVEEELQQLRNKIIHSEIELPFAFKVNILQKINKMLKKLKETSRTNLKELVDLEIKNLLNEKPIEKNPFILHYISNSGLDEEFPLQKATKLCSDRPVLLIAMCNGILKARCCVPEKYATSKFNAEQWLREFAEVFRSQVAPPKGQNALLVCNMKGKKVTNKFKDQLDIAIKQANKFAESHLNMSC